jgi:tetratricopeptide (TPR) repeat protein
MRESLSKRSKTTAKITAKAKLSGNGVKSKVAKVAKPTSAAKPKSAKLKAAPKPKSLSTTKPKQRTTAKAAPKPAKPAKKTAKKIVALKKVVAKTPKPVSKPTAKKPATKIEATKKVTKRISSAAKPVAKPAKVKAKAPIKAVVITNKKVTPVKAAPPPEPPRRASTTAALRAFEHAVRVFNRRHFEDAKAMFESLLAKFPNEVEIIARSQMYLQVCTQKLAHLPSTPRNADELYDQGVYALNLGDFSQAKNFFEKALRMKPEEPHLLYSLAAAHAQTGAHDQALDYLKRTIQIQPRYRTQALNDSDFSELRENKQFLELLGLASPFDILQARR